MKKVMLLFGLMGMVFISHATESVVPSGNIDSSWSNEISREMADLFGKVETGEGTCTVTHTGKVTIYFIEYTVSCSATGANCRVAQSEAVGCAQEGIEIIKRAIQK